MYFLTLKSDTDQFLQIKGPTAVLNPELNPELIVLSE